MSSIERLRTDDEFFWLTDTISSLRKIRTAWTVWISWIQKSFWWNIKNLFKKTITPQSIEPQETLKDAERLGTSCGDFLAGKRSKTNNGSIEYQKWQDYLSDYNKKYKNYKATTFADTNKDEILSHFVGRLRTLNIDPKYFLKREFTQNNNLWATSVNQLIKNNVTIVSPLSWDYTLSCIYNAYLYRTKWKTFDLYPIGLNKELTKAIFPKAIEDDNRKKIWIYIDTNETWSTAKCLFNELSIAYPKKEIIYPTTENIGFVENEKIKRFRNDIKASK